MASYHNFFILVCLVAANLSGCLFLGKQVVVSFVESAIILHCVKLNFWATPGKAGLIFYSSHFLCYSNIKTTKMIPSTSTKKTGLLMFRAVAEPRNSGKSAKFGGNLIRYMSVLILKLVSATGLLAVNSQIHVKTSSLKRANNVPKLPGVDYVVKNWALAMMLKALPLVHF